MTVPVPAPPAALSTPEVTIVVPAYKAERTIRRTLLSVLAQQGVRLEIIVVVDGLFDGTLQHIRDLDDPRVRTIVNKVNQGASKSRNAGLAQACGAFVMFVDADDFVEGNLLRGLLETMKSDEADLGFGPMQIFFEDTGHRYPRFEPAWTTHAEVFWRWHGTEQYVNPTSIMWRTEYLRGIGGWDPDATRNDDGELAMRAILLGARFVTSSQGQGVYVKHASDTMNHRADNMDSMLRINRKLLGMPSPVVAEEDKRQACAHHYFVMGCHAYLNGRDDLGDQAIQAARALGVRSHGPLHYRIGHRMLGPRRLSLFVRSLQQGLARLGRLRAQRSHRPATVTARP